MHIHVYNFYNFRWWQFEGESTEPLCVNTKSCGLMSCIISLVALCCKVPTWLVGGGICPNITWIKQSVIAQIDAKVRNCTWQFRTGLINESRSWKRLELSGSLQEPCDSVTPFLRVVLAERVKERIVRMLLTMVKDTGVFQNTAQFLCICSNVTVLVDVLQHYRWPVSTHPEIWMI